MWWLHGAVNKHHCEYAGERSINLTVFATACCPLHVGTTRQHPGGFSAVMRWLQGDVKERLCQYAEEQSIDLIVVLTAGAGSKLRKGYNLSSHLQHHAPCPVLAIPIRTPGPPRTPPALASCPCLCCIPPVHASSVLPS